MENNQITEKIVHISGKTKNAQKHAREINTPLASIRNAKSIKNIQTKGIQKQVFKINSKSSVGISLTRCQNKKKQKFYKSCLKYSHSRFDLKSNVF